MNLCVSSGPKEITRFNNPLPSDRNSSTVTSSMLRGVMNGNVGRPSPAGYELRKQLSGVSERRRLTIACGREQ